MLRALIAIGQQKNSVYLTTASWKVVASKSKLKRFPMKGRFVNRGPGGIELVKLDQQINHKHKQNCEDYIC